MQDRYVGDVGDFGKFALLRAISDGKRVGICWYRTDGSSEKNSDGKHTSYERHKCVDPIVYAKLLRLLNENKRSISQLENSNLIANAIFHDKSVPPSGQRSDWFAAMRQKMLPCDLVLLDPDNGLAKNSASKKHVTLNELKALRTVGRTVVLYCHQDRTAGGAANFVTKIREQLQSIGNENAPAIRLRAGTSRFYFFIDCDNVILRRAREFAKRWPNDCCEFID